MLAEPGWAGRSAGATVLGCGQGAEAPLWCSRGLESARRRGGDNTTTRAPHRCTPTITK